MNAKTTHSLIFFILIFLALAAIFFVLNKKSAGQVKTLRQTLGCHYQTIDDSILNLDGATTRLLAFITFKQTPLDQPTLANLDKWGVELDEGSWIFDHVIAQIPTANLCDLAADPAVKMIFIPQEENQTVIAQ